MQQMPRAGEPESLAVRQAVSQVDDPRERLALMVEYRCRILARTRPIHAVIRGAADREAFAAALRKRLLHERLANQTERIAEYLGDALNDGLDLRRRTASLRPRGPELYGILTVEFGWTADRHRAWLTALLATELLRPQASS